jgi:hypothetical protein
VTLVWPFFKLDNPFVHVLLWQNAVFIVWRKSLMNFHTPYIASLTKIESLHVGLLWCMQLSRASTLTPPAVKDNSEVKVI